ncbi:hypothetical protein [Bacillus sp. X1(2014)]|uniref:hypothetical protein n=1 Tax=Bacillus sp. X1(2014) TaxID=1565991 RepID=UPI0011A61376|nr:hypothetical protein [Bacillus sp. X1(2014)]
MTGVHAFGVIIIFDFLDGVEGGDVMIIPDSTLQNHLYITEHVKEWAKKGAVPIVLGGDQSI